jgi:hypothetical protein
MIPDDAPYLTGFSEHKTFDVTCSRMNALTSVGEWLSLVEHLVRDQGVGGSNPLSPTNLFFNHLKQIAAGQWRAFFRSYFRCAQNCAHSVDLGRQELHLRSGERIWQT